MSLPIPDFPTLFIKPSTSLADPYPSPTILPKLTQIDNTGDYESEMVIVIGRDAKDVPESEALDYVLGYTAANDVSSRTYQMNQSQWCFSKGFDGACPIGKLAIHYNRSLNCDPGEFSRHLTNMINRTRPCLHQAYSRCWQASNSRLEERKCHAGLPSDVRIQNKGLLLPTVKS